MAMQDSVEERTLAKIKGLKSATFGSAKINCTFDGLNYSLVLLTADCAENAGLMDMVGRWRKENEQWFFSQFPVTVERTTRWFKDKVTGAPDRLLFLIAAGGGYVGHVGLFRFDFDNKTCEIDNIVRGEAGYPGIMGNAITHMMAWGKTELGLSSYSLRTTSDNERARRLYERLGFKVTSRIPLIQVEGKDGLEWTEAPEGYAQETGKYYLVMKLPKSA